jgi:hypothetical protein
MAVKPLPEGYHTVTPSLTVKGAAKLIEFIEAAREAGANVEHQPGSDDDCNAGGTVGGRRRKGPGVAQPDDSALPAADRAGG